MSGVHHWWDSKETLLWFQRLKRWWLLPLKPTHEDRLIALRRARFKHVGHRSARREGFRTHWREQGLSSMALAGMPRRVRRRLMRRQWAASKRERA